jgi:RTX calcium-binding nonapeptide repeat (4 copies)
MFTSRPSRTPRSKATFAALMIVPAFGALATVTDAAAQSPPGERAAPAAAQAAPTVGTTVQSLEDRGGLFVRARVGKANVINVALTNVTFTVRDTGDDVVAGPGCTSVDAHTVRCDAFGAAITIDSGDLNDVINAPTPLATTVHAGAGDDTVTTGSGADSLQGAIGNDKLTAGAGADRLDGNTGKDVLDGKSGRDTLQGGGRADEADVLIGGAGTDMADYSGRGRGRSGPRCADETTGRPRPIRCRTTSGGARRRRRARRPRRRRVRLRRSSGRRRGGGRGPRP